MLVTKEPLAQQLAWEVLLAYFYLPQSKYGHGVILVVAGFFAHSPVSIDISVFILV